MEILLFYVWNNFDMIAKNKISDDDTPEYSYLLDWNDNLLRCMLSGFKMIL